MSQWRRQYCIQVFVPLRRGDGSRVRREELEALEHRFTDLYGGVTAYVQAPADGMWDERGPREKDQVVVIEVLAEALDGAAWAEVQAELERRFQQDEVLIRAYEVQRLAR